MISLLLRALIGAAAVVVIALAATSVWIAAAAGLVFSWSRLHSTAA